MTNATPMSAGVEQPSRKLEAIRALGRADFALIPLEGKKPTFEGWENTPPGSFKPEDLIGGNYGVVLRAGALVVDVDPRNFKEGDRPLERLVERVGPLASFTVRTGGGGLHIYFRVPADLLVRNSLKEYPGIEFKAAGRQVVGPGSIHPETGREYVVTAGDPSAIAAAPEALVNLVRRSVVPFEEVTGGTGAYVNDAATQGRFLAYLQDAAPTSGSYAVACKGRDLGLPPATTWELMVECWNKRRVVPRTPEELRVRVVHAYTYARGPVGSAHPSVDFKDAPPPAAPAPGTEAALARKEEEFPWETTKQGAYVRSFRNLVFFLRYPKAGLVDVFGQNDFTGRVEFMRPAPWHRGRMPSHLGVSDNDLKLLKGHLAVRHGFEMTVKAIEEAVTNVADENRFHPVREYLEGLKWDGVPRMDTWLVDHLGAEDTPYTRAVARKMLCAAVMRIFRPGVKFDHVPVFEGLQGIGKSGVCGVLGGPWAADFPLDPHNKDSIQLMQGKWIIELAEMETTRRADLQALKAFISRPKDEARLAYGRTVGEFPRQSIFIGSINPGADGTYLQDDENRRWWPVMCKPKGGRVDFRAFKDARNQLWAEAVHHVRTRGEKLFMDTKELEDAARAVVAERHAEHAWTERIASWLCELDNRPETRRDFLTARDVYVDAMGGIDKQLDRKSCLAIASVLRSLGWVRGHKRVGGRFTSGYVRAGTQKAVLAAQLQDPFASPIVEDPFAVPLEKNHVASIPELL